MNTSLKAVVIEVSEGSLTADCLNLHGAFGLFPENSFGGSDSSKSARPITLQIGGASIDTDIDEAKAIFRERGAIRQFFRDESVTKGDLVLLERVGDRTFALSKASKRGFTYHL